MKSVGSTRDHRRPCRPRFDHVICGDNWCRNYTASGQNKINVRWAARIASLFILIRSTERALRIAIISSDNAGHPALRTTTTGRGALLRLALGIDYPASTGAPLVVGHSAVVAAASASVYASRIAASSAA